MTHSTAQTPLESRASGPLSGKVRVPGDKSISHRALILGALSVGKTEISGLLEGEDVLNTAKSMQVLGAKVDVPTPYGTIALRVPPRTSSGARLRIKGHGVRHADGTSGDLYAEVQIILPETIDGELMEAVRKLESGRQNDPRRDLRW